MISFSPSINFSDLFYFLKRKKNSFNDLHSIFCKDKDDKLYYFSRSSWAICSVALLRKNACIFIPEYYCDEAIFLLRKIKVKIIFYKINEDNSFDISDIKKKAKLYKPDIILFCNFFGINHFKSYLYDLKKTYNSIIIEDSTHSLIPNYSIGNKGDFIIYSPYKLVPIPTGSIMVSKQNLPGLSINEDNFFINKIINAGIDVPNKKTNIFQILKWSSKQILKIFGINKIRIEPFEKDYYLKSEKELYHPALDIFSKYLMRQFLSNSQNILEKRKQMFNLISKVIKQKSIKFSKSITLKEKANKHYPYMIEIEGDQINLKKFYNYLKELNLPVLTWPSLPIEVKENLGNNVSVIKKRNSKFYIPIHYQPKNFIKLLSEEEFNSYDFEFIKVDNKDWLKLYNKCKKKNILNNIYYLNSQEKIFGIKNQKYKIVFQGEEIALFVLLKKKFLFLNFNRINRSPIYLNQNLDKKLKENLIKKILQFENDKPFTITKFSPEYSNSYHSSFIDYKKKNFIFDGDGWKSSIIDLKDDILKIRENLNQKWRNSLNAFEKRNIIIEEENSNQIINDLITYYEKLQKMNNFKGINKKFLKYFLENSFKKIYCAYDDKIFLGYICISTDFNTGTYLLGFANDKGRKINVMNGLMWKAIVDLKEKNFDYLDLGGMDNNSTPGIFKFKSGLNAKNYSLIGSSKKIKIF